KKEMVLTLSNLYRPIATAPVKRPPCSRGKDSCWSRMWKDASVHGESAASRTTLNATQTASLCDKINSGCCIFKWQVMK
uniref:Uncharacterized protein n=1 Tax=Sander lucioperca TaxID=283035 RepID=A0A8C9ZUG1_SANLU